ncbi:MAG: hypothetical protein Ct9H300mP8_04780 [Gammaproteobacteria bacterium]|nr:MAG: hypothetical protein Ct9H300mP8_04780 [Gammaproteobacteria bacterium]
MGSIGTRSHHSRGARAPVERSIKLGLDRLPPGNATLEQCPEAINIPLPRGVDLHRDVAVIGDLLANVVKFGNGATDGLIYCFVFIWLCGQSPLPAERASTAAPKRREMFEPSNTAGADLISNAREMIAENNVEDAIVLLERALRLDPQNGHTWLVFAEGTQPHGISSS